MGRGAEELGKLLIKGFIFSLTQLAPPPEAVIFLNGGARLTTEGANTVPDLKALEEKGAGIYTCGTCANYYKLSDALAVGSIVDMMRITNLLAKASVVITI
jgi:selenium metabolism protein YedF